MRLWMTLAAGTACAILLALAEYRLAPLRSALADPAPYNGLVKAIDGEMPAPGEASFLRNLWLCRNQATDGIDNDGDSTADNEPATCLNQGEGELVAQELLFAGIDCDTRNDDDDDDGYPVDGSVADGSSTPYIGSNPRPECPQPTLEDFVQDWVDKDGGEAPEGVGAFEFHLKFDHKVFDISVTLANGATDGVDNDGDTAVDEPDEDWANGRFAFCGMSIVTENDIRFGCVSSGTNPGHAGGQGLPVATIVIAPEDDLAFRIRPGKDNGVTRLILQSNCQIADIYGDIFPNTNAGLTPSCTDIDLTVRRLEGDVDRDCDVDLQDTQQIGFRYGSFFGQLLYNQIYDLEPFTTLDFDIDIKDMQFVFGRDGSTCAAPIPDNQWPIPAEGVGQP